jgi:hypothetical protein
VTEPHAARRGVGFCRYGVALCRAMNEPGVLLTARAMVLHDLAARGFDDAVMVSLLEDAVAGRQWWLDQWPDGAEHIAGLVAQDVQDRLVDSGVRWPRCTACDDLNDHELRIEPELGPDPTWVCERAGITVSPLGHLT